MLRKKFLSCLGIMIINLACETGPTSEGIPIDVIAVTPLESVVGVGETVQFTAEARDVDLNPLEGVTYTWSSSHPETVKIDATGLATGLTMAREVVITASAEGVESNNAIVHVAGDPASIDLGLPSEAVLVGKTISLQANIRDALGTALPGAAVTGWTVTDPALVSVALDGTLTGLSKGVTTVRAEYEHLFSDSLRIYIWALAFQEDFSTTDTTTIGEYYFRGAQGIIWQINHELKTDTTSAGPYTGRPTIVEESGNPVLRLTEPSTAYFTNRQMLIMTYGTTAYDEEYMWPLGDNLLTGPNFRVQLRMKGIDDPVAGSTAESLAIFTQYFAGAASPYYLVYAPGRNRVSAWFGASLAAGASIPEWGAMPEIVYDQWFQVVVEVFDGTMRTEVFTGAEPSGEWDYTYTIPDWTGTEENLPGFWFGTFLVDEYYADDILYYTP